MRVTRIAIAAAVLMTLASSASAQVVKQMTIIVAKFQNDPSEPLTVEEVRASVAPTASGGAQTFGDFLKFATNGLMTLDVRVIPTYITIPYDKRPAPGGCTMPGPNEGTFYGTSWESAVVAAAVAAGYQMVGKTWAVLPQLWGQCSHVDKVGASVNGGLQLGGSVPTYYAWGVLGLPLAIAWQCVGGDSTTFVVISNNCLQPGGQRNVKTIDGQGQGVFSLFARRHIGAMPADRLRTISSAPSSPVSFTLTALEVTPPVGGTQGVLLPSILMNLEYHVASPFQGGWEAGCVVGYHAFLNNILDFTPDGNWGGGLCSNQTYVHQSGLRIRTGTATPTGIPITIDQTTPPPPLTVPPASPNCTITEFGQTLSNGVSVFSIQPGSYAPMRDGQVIPGGAIVWKWKLADGAVYAMGSDTNWSRYDVSTNRLFFSSVAEPMCVGATPQPPPPPTGADLTENGTATSSEPASPAGEDVTRAFDNSRTTKWLTWKPTGWVQYQLPAPAVVTSYALVAGAEQGQGARDPRDWRLEGSNDGATWTSLDTQAGRTFTYASTGTRLVFPITNTAAFLRYRLTVTANRGAPYLQLWELELYSDGSTPPPPPSNPCVESPLVPVVSITAAGHTLRWPSFVVTDERNCPATVPARP